MPRRITEGDSVTVVELPTVVRSCNSADFIPPYERAYKKLISSLLSRERRRGMRTKSLYDNLFSLSVTRAVRILAIRYYSKMHCYWVIADLETNHDRYERKIPSFDLNPALRVLRQLVLQREERLREEAVEITIPNLYPEEHSPDLAAQYNAIIRSASKYRNQIVRTSKEQHLILEELKARLTHKDYLSLVTGPAGSGKSFLAFMLLKWLTEQEIEAVFIASSKKLRIEQKNDWLLSISADADEDMASFFGYIGFLKDIDLIQDDPEREDNLCVPVEGNQFLSIVGDEHLRLYYEEVRKKNAKNRRRLLKVSKVSGGGVATRGSASSFDSITFEVLNKSSVLCLKV